MYKLTRIGNYGKETNEYIGAFTEAYSVTYGIPEKKNIVNELPPLVGDGLVVRGSISVCDNCNTHWRTTEITKVVDIDRGWMITTKNSLYKLVKWNPGDSKTE